MNRTDLLADIQPGTQGVLATIVVNIEILGVKPVVDRIRNTADSILRVTRDIHQRKIATRKCAFIIHVSRQPDIRWLESKWSIQHGGLRRPVADRKSRMQD